MIIIKNILFDLGSVILKGRSISVLNKIDIDENIYNELKRFFDDWKDLDLGNETLEEKYNKCNFPSEYDKKYKNFLINYYRYRDINMDLISLINKLKQKNYKVYIFSNNNRECMLYHKDQEYFKNVDGWVVSCDYNAIKQDGKLFDIIINKYNLNVDECYFIDDNKDIIDEALKYGIKSYIFNEDDDINNLYNDMRNNGIDF